MEFHKLQLSPQVSRQIMAPTMQTTFSLELEINITWKNWQTVMRGGATIY